MKVKTKLGSSRKLFYKSVDVPSRVIGPRDAFAKALAPSVWIYVPATIVKIGRWAMVMRWARRRWWNSICIKDEDDDGELDYQEENDPFTDKLLGLPSDGDDDSVYDDKEENIVNFLLA